MNLLLRLEAWGDRHHPRWIDLVRIALGIFLIFKGLDFLLHMSKLIGLMGNERQFGDFAYVLAGHYTVFAHLLGGLALVLGVFVRASCILQIPILLGALFFVGTNKNLLEPYSQLLITAVVLLLLIYFLIAGNGPLSLNIGNEDNKSRQQ